MRSGFSKIVASVAMSAIVSGLPSLTFAQVSAAASAGASQSSQTRAEQKAERKIARKQARAKKNAELKKLEDAGYNPARANDINYPQDIQDAQKKASSGSTPSK